ncbi:MAG TPA: HDOD domain-containing protein [Gemmatimonadales bacterium]|nr:HDOD domain-containing protein [Gemmatimonadales bacterium]
MPSFIQRLLALLETAEHLPTLPEVVLQLHRALEDEKASGAVIAEIIGRDPALAAKVVGAANSAFLARSAEPITSIAGAIARLGLREVRSICAVLAFVRAFGGRGAGLDYQRFWIHSATVAGVAQWLGFCADPADRRRADELYIAGLLHDVGLLILDQYFAPEFASASRTQADTGEPRWIVEERELGMDHGEVGGLLLGKWLLPPAVIDAVIGHHRPDSAPAPHRLGARFVHAAEVLTGAAGLGLPEEGAVEAPEPALRGLGLEPARLPELLAEVEAIGHRMGRFLDRPAGAAAAGR